MSVRLRPETIELLRQLTARGKKLVNAADDFPRVARKVDGLRGGTGASVTNNPNGIVISAKGGGQSRGALQNFSPGGGQYQGMVFQQLTNNSGGYGFLQLVPPLGS